MSGSLKFAGAVGKVVRGPRRQVQPTHTGLRYDVVQWRGREPLARGLTMDVAKAKARAWNAGKPAQEWVMLVPSAVRKAGAR